MYSILCITLKYERNLKEGAVVHASRCSAYRNSLGNTI